MPTAASSARRVAWARTGFFGLHMIAVDSAGYVSTGEVFQGERVQRFVPAESAKGQLLRALPDTL